MRHIFFLDYTLSEVSWLGTVLEQSLGVLAFGISKEAINGSGPARTETKQTIL